VVINAGCSLRTEADLRVIVVAGLPVHHYRAEDKVAEAYAMVFLVGRGSPSKRMWPRRIGRAFPGSPIERCTATTGVPVP
jgi:hypothetical protein